MMTPKARMPTASVRSWKSITRPRGSTMTRREHRGTLRRARQPTALVYWIGASRETFEEAGLLVAVDADGRDVDVSPSRFADYRKACHRENAAFWTMIRAERLTLATDRLVYFAHWITPEEQPLRFDTRFFAAPAPAGQEAS